MEDSGECNSLTKTKNAAMLLGISMLCIFFSGIEILSAYSTMLFFLMGLIMAGLSPALIIAIRRPHESGNHKSGLVAAGAWGGLSLLLSIYFALILQVGIVGIGRLMDDKALEFIHIAPSAGLIPIALAMATLIRKGPFQRWTISRTFSVSFFTTTLILLASAVAEGRGVPYVAIGATLFAVVWGGRFLANAIKKIQRGEVVIGLLMGIFFYWVVTQGMPEFARYLSL
jgi:hypothetical protein